MADDVKQAVHNYFREFGHEVGEAVYAELRKSGGMPRLLKKLGIPVEGSAEDQYRMLIQHFRRQGTEYFMQLVGAKPINYKIDVVTAPENKDDDTRKRLGLKTIAETKISTRHRKLSQAETQRAPGGGTTSPLPPPSETRRLSGTDTTNPPPGRAPSSGSSQQKSKITPVQMDPPNPKGEGQQTPVRPTPISSTPPRSSFPNTPIGGEVPTPPAEEPAVEPIPQPEPSGRPSPYDEVDEEGYPKGPLMPAPSPDPSDVDPTGPSWDPDKPWDPTGTWPEVERRSGRERRHKPDRRAELDIVFKNRRYGGDRREGDERRKNWPKGGHQ